jgi:hypothetical protein
MRWGVRRACWRLDIRPEVVIEELGYAPGTGGRKRGEGQTGFETRPLPDIHIAVLDQRRKCGTETRVLLEQAVNAPALFEDGALPALAPETLRRLRVPLEEMHHELFQATLQGVLLAFPQALHLLG